MKPEPDWHALVKSNLNDAERRKFVSAMELQGYRYIQDLQAVQPLLQPAGAAASVLTCLDLHVYLSQLLPFCFLAVIFAFAVFSVWWLYVWHLLTFLIAYKTNAF